MSEAGLFDNIPNSDPLALFAGGRPDYPRVAELLSLSRNEVALASNVPKKYVRYDAQMPKELQDRMKEWAIVVGLVASHFKEAEKTALWFRVPNPQLGDFTPRDMIRFGRFKKLHRFIVNALRQNAPEAE